MQSSEITNPHDQLYTFLRKNRGAIKMIAETAGCSRNWVQRVLSGGVKSDKVIAAAEQVVNKINAKNEAYLKRVAALSKQ